MTYLVTGGAGFIGSNIVETLLKRGEKVRVLDDFSTGKRGNLSFDIKATVEVIEGDIRDLGTCQRAVKNVRFVLHHAALGSVQRSVEDPLSTHEINLKGTLNMLLASRDGGVKRFVYASSSSVYGDQADEGTAAGDPEFVSPKTERMTPDLFRPMRRANWPENFIADFSAISTGSERFRCDTSMSLAKGRTRNRSMPR